MTEPLQVDTDGLDAASAILKSAAGQIPTPLPQFSVNGSDPLSAAIAAGSAQMEAPMAALPGIKADATTTAENIGVAGQRYRETDETLAQKAKEQQFDKNAQEIKGLSHSQSAIEQLMRTMTEGGIPKPPDIHSGPGVPDTPKGPWWSLDVSADDWTMGGVGAAIGAKTDLPGEFVKKATENVAKGEPGHWAKTAFSDIKGLKGVSRASGILGAPLVVWQISGAMVEDPTMSIYQATAKEGGGFLAGAAAGALIGSAIPIPVVGTVAGLVAGGVVGVLGGEVIDKAWEPVGDAVEDAAGAVVKALGGLFG